MHDKPRITMTDAARAKFLEIVAAEGRPGSGLRVTVHNAGTAEPEFALNFVDPGKAREQDRVVDVGQVHVHVDEGHVEHLDGASIDFVETLSEAGFKIDAPNAGIAKPSGPVAEAVQKVLDEQVNPAVAMHGGHVALVAIESETAYLKFGGGCQGCGMINVTLKQGVERVIFDAVPQITRVMDVTDHAAGSNPYYQPAK
jgi:Fe/S biogenesis protein NfuA